MNLSRYEAFENGSTWLRADFHLHTKADKEFEYDGPEDRYLKKYISKLEESGIELGIITNHNKFDLEEFINLRKEARKKEIFLFPGVELSVNDGANGIHCLIVFDYNTWYINKKCHDFINKFLSSAFEEKINWENEKCNYSLDKLLKTLDSHRKKGRDSFIIMGHVEDKNGFLNEFKGGRIEQYKDNELFRKSVLGLQKVRTRDYVDKLKQWLDNRLPAFVEGSDCKEMELLGKVQVQNSQEKITYIKIGDYNFAALKFALLDKKNKIEDRLPEPKHAYVESFVFEGGKLNEKN